jgi:hypothetical protein
MNQQVDTNNDGGFSPPHVERTSDGDISTSSLADIIQWFLNYDERVAIIRHPSVEEVFQWKQAQSQQQNEGVFLFNTAEDRLAIGIVQALGENQGEQDLHAWISQLLNALDDATKTNEEIAESYELSKVKTESTVERAQVIPTSTERLIYLNSCWLEALCTAEIRVLGWIYQDLFSRPFHPDNFH